MKKKISIWLISIVGLVALTVGVTYEMVYVADDPVNKKASTEVDTSQYKTVPREKESMTGQIDGVFMNLPITESSTEDEVIKAMHHMTHQKVVATQKWGTIPMSKKNAEKIRDIIKDGNFEKKEELLAITERWINRDFSKIVEDHNYFWTSQEGNVGKATGVMDAASEQTFVLNNFGEEITQELFKQGDLKEIK
ncbi:PRK06770 family protein [Bacillus tropicus]|uniref:PRK06770 family protein n=1 Tax=Bacillus tropicus TaxID=2026188 RepID=UPI0023AF3851|nr:PRK06770 family protein [Bacillus tropicus]MDE7573788.1 PRK06770 family protein [Bacillus tropicus]